MDLEKMQNEVKKQIAIELDEFYDEKLKEKMSDEKLDDKDITIQKNFDNLNHNHKKVKIYPENQSTENNSYKKTASTTKTKTDNIIRKDNMRKAAFFAPFIFLKKFFKKNYNLNIDSLNCDIVLGTSIRHMKIPLKLKIYQIICFDPLNIEKIILILNSEMISSKKLTFIYFMTRTYEEIYNRYIIGDINFPLFKGGTVRISGFITLEKEIIDKENKGETKEKIEAFKELSLNVIKDIKDGKLEREERIKKPINDVVSLKQFEDLRNNFKADINYEETKQNDNDENNMEIVD